MRRVTNKTAETGLIGSEAMKASVAASLRWRLMEVIRSCDRHHIIIDYREVCGLQHSRDAGAVLNCRRLNFQSGGERPCSTFINQTSRVAIEGRIAERRRADNSNELTMNDYYLRSAKAKAQAEVMWWLCQL